MTTKQMSMIVGAIVLAGILVAFGPGLLGNYQQAQRDDSLECTLYGLADSVDNLAALKGQSPDRAAAGCNEERPSATNMYAVCRPYYANI